MGGTEDYPGEPSWQARWKLRLRVFESYPAWRNRSDGAARPGFATVRAQKSRIAHEGQEIRSEPSGP